MTTKKSKNFYNPKEIVILPTLQCPSNCRHCGLSNEVKKSIEEKMDVSDWKRVIKDAKSIGIKEVVFSGGEPMVKYGDVKELIKFSYSLDLTTSLVTGCGAWKDIKKQMEELKNAGLKMLGISYDIFHKEFVDENTVYSILREALRNPPLEVTICASNTKTTALGNIKILKGIAEVLEGILTDIVIFEEDDTFSKYCKIQSGKRTINIEFREIDNVGNAKENIPVDDYFFYSKEKLKKLKCPGNNGLSILPNGEILPCCSFCAVNNFSDYSLGNYFHGTTLQEAIEKVNKDSFYKTIMVGGFWKILEKFSEIEEENSEIKGGYTSICTVCEEAKLRKIY